MKNMQISVPSIIAFVLLLQCHARHAFDVSISDSLEDYANEYVSNLKKLAVASKESTVNAFETLQKHGQNIANDIRNFRLSLKNQQSHLWGTLGGLERDLNITSKELEEAFDRYKNVSHGDVSFKEAHIAFAENTTKNFCRYDYYRFWILTDAFLFKEKMEIDSNGCTFPQKFMSQQQFFKVLLKTVQYGLIQYYAAINISYGIMEHFGYETVHNVPHSIKLMLDGYRRVADSFKKNMPGLSRDFYACDSESGDSSSFIVLKPFQKYLFTEDQISPGYPGKRSFCKKRCEAVNEMTNPIVCNQSTYEHHEANNNDLICKKVRGCTNIYCPELGSDIKNRILDEFELCLNPTHSFDRYQFYHSEGMSNGKNCRDGYNIWIRHKPILAYSVRGGSRYNVTGDDSYCTICDCTCLDNDYYISAQSSYTDYDDDMVVVGAKFVLLKNTLYIKLRQAKLLPNGEINATTFAWKSIKEDESNRIRIDWKDLRAIDLSYNEVPEGQTLIGLRFRRIEDSKAETSSTKFRVGLDILSLQYDFAKGRFAPHSLPTWHYHYAYESQPKTKLELLGHDEPTRNSGNRLISTKDQYVVFDTTSSISDGGQSTVPYFDDRELVPQTLTPLSGAGLVYMGQEGSGGYVGLRFTTYDVSPHINTK